MLSPEFRGPEPELDFIVPDSPEGLVNEEAFKMRLVFSRLNRELKRLKDIDPNHTVRSFHRLPLDSAITRSVFINQYKGDQGVFTRIIVNEETVQISGDTDIVIADFAVLAEKQAIAVVSDRSAITGEDHHLAFHSEHGPYLAIHNRQLRILSGRDYKYKTPPYSAPQNELDCWGRRVAAEQLLEYIEPLNIVTVEEELALPY